jgi:hypothetical protein
MAKNIYDLFNERKYGVDFLTEGYDANLDNVEAFDNIDALVENLNQITLESTNEAIELQAAWYLEDLVIENMMYDDFDEDRILGVMEGSMKGKVNSAKEKVMGWWKKIKEWFARVFKSVVNFFKSGETLVRQNKAKIPGAIKACDAKVKMNRYNDLDAGMAKIKDLVMKLGDSRTSSEDGKKEVLAIVGVEDKKEVGKMVKKIFIAEEGAQLKVNEIDPAKAMHFAGDKKFVMDGLKKQQKDIDNAFKNVLNLLKDERKDVDKKDTDGRESADRVVSNFSFALGIKNILLNTQMKIINKACKDYAAVIRRALGKKAEPEKEEAGEEEAPAAGGEVEATGESFIPEVDEIEFLNNSNDEWNW